MGCLHGQFRLANTRQPGHRHHLRPVRIEHNEQAAQLVVAAGEAVAAQDSAEGKMRAMAAGAALLRAELGA